MNLFLFANFRTKLNTIAFVIVNALIGLLLISCKQSSPFEEIPSEAELQISNVRLVDSVFLTLAVDITIVDVDNQTETFGLCWSKSEQPTISDDTLHFDKIDEEFTSSIEHLRLGVDLHVRAFGKTTEGNFFYSNELEYAFPRNKWYRLPDPPFKNRDSGTGLVLDGKIYYGLGMQNGDIPANDIYCFNPNSNQWDIIPNFPGHARWGAIGFTINSEICIGTGASVLVPTASDDYFKDFYCFNIESSQWREIMHLPETASPRAFGFGFDLFEKGFVLAGRAENFLPLKDFWSYHPSENRWIQLEDFNYLRYGLNGFKIKDEIYAGTGTNTSQGGNDILRYFPIEKKWEVEGVFTGNRRSGAFMFSINEKGYIGGGASGAGNTQQFHSDFFEFDPTANDVEYFNDVAPFPKGIVGAVGVSVDGIGYIIGGCTQKNNDPRMCDRGEKIFYAYLPE